jgi:hypothetical protein
MLIPKSYRLPVKELLVAIVSEFQLTHDSGKKQEKKKYPMLCIEF